MDFLILHPILLQFFGEWMNQNFFLQFYFRKGSKRDSNFAYLEFLFFIQWNSLNWLGQAFSVVCWQISSTLFISNSLKYGFGDKLNQKAESQNLNFLINFTFNFKAVLYKIIIFMGNWWIIEKIAILFLKWVKKMAQISKYHIFGRHIYHSDTWNSKTRQMSNRQ